MSATKWVRLSEIAQHCGLSKHTIYKFARSGVIPHGRAGRVLVFNINDVDEWIRQRGSSGQLDFPAAEEKARQADQEEEVDRISSDILANT